MEKNPEDVEDADVRELCASAPPHPVRCSGKMKILNFVSLDKGRLCGKLEFTYS